MKNRYNRYYRYGEVKFYLSDYMPTPERCRFLVLKILEQAVREYCAFINSTVPSEQASWEMARDFLFNDEYRFIWGDHEISLEVFLGYADLEVDWVREQTQKRLKRSDKKRNKRGR